jgi:hypothetical protein
MITRIADASSHPEDNLTAVMVIARLTTHAGTSS